MRTFNHAHRAIHFPADRSPQVWTSRRGPLSLLTGMAMSPALDNPFPWFPELFGGRQAARSVHFLLLVGYLGFLVVHVSLVVATGFVWNMNHIVLGLEDQTPAGLILGPTAIATVVAS